MFSWLEQIVSPSREPFDERNVVEERMDDFELLRQHWDEIDDELQFKNDVGEGIDACAHQPAIESDIPREPSSPAPPPPKSESSMIGVAYYYPPPKPVPEKPMEECPAVERYLPMSYTYIDGFQPFPGEKVEQKMSAIAGGPDKRKPPP
ncbi:hypothetical protein AC249_AIPGENE14854 [Exaiptasia diaphana]|nr:hypothetical protein AC249_AIPGENE14854 [Exaiptasia diaphana]